MNKYQIAVIELRTALNIICEENKKATQGMDRTQAREYTRNNGSLELLRQIRQAEDELLTFTKNKLIARFPEKRDVLEASHDIEALTMYPQIRRELIESAMRLG